MPVTRPAARKTSTLAILPLQRQTLTGMTAEILRDRILRGGFPEGEPLRQDAIAEELGVSRIPVREALRQLEAEGLVTFNPHRGAVVSTLSTQEISELFEVRSEIESDLVRRAIPHMTPDDDMRAKEILDAYDVAIRDGDVMSFGALNWQFHATLYAPSARPFTLGIVNKLHQQSDRYMRMLIALAHLEERAKQEHLAIAEAAQRRDTRLTSRLLRTHILGAGRVLVGFLEEHRGEGARARRSRVAR